MSGKTAQDGGPRATSWAEVVRLRTLPAAVAPVILGSGAAAATGDLSWVRFFLAAGVALALQVGCNLANDYSDGVRGTDDERTGPPRLTASGQVAPRTVKFAAFGCFGLGALLGLGLLALSGQWWLLVVGAAAIAAAWFYTGGSRPYGYAGLGELFVFIFFGLVATAGTTYVQTDTVPGWLWPSACGIGLLACSLLMVNNLRDIDTDPDHGKMTLAPDSWSSPTASSSLPPPSSSPCEPGPRRASISCAETSDSQRSTSTGRSRSSTCPGASSPSSPSRAFSPDS